MPIVNGYSLGTTNLLAQLIVPFQQFPLSQAILGANNWQAGIVYNQAHFAQPVDCGIYGFTVTAYGAVPTAGALTLSIMASGNAVFSATIDPTLLTIAAAAPSQIYAATPPLPVVPVGTDITLVGTSSAYAQSIGGICVAVWGMAVG